LRKTANPRLINQRRAMAGNANGVQRGVAPQRQKKAPRQVAAAPRNPSGSIRASYLDMIGGLSASPFRARLLAMDGGRPAARHPAPQNFAPLDVDLGDGEYPYRDAAD
jgi:hypothetical protein